MEAQPKELRFYEDGKGKQPYRDWFDSLRDKRAQAKIQARVERVALGNLGYTEKVGEGVVELKIDYGPGFRVYFGQMGTQLVILLCGGDKSTQKRDIKTAHDYWADYRRRYGG